MLRKQLLTSTLLLLFSASHANSLLVKEELSRTFPVSADTYIDKKNPDTNYGSDTTIVINKDKTGLVQYDLAPTGGFPDNHSDTSGIVASCDSIYDGKLKLNIINAQGSDTIRLKIMPIEPFDESLITYATAPKDTGPAYQVNIAPDFSGELAIDVSKALQKGTSAFKIELQQPMDASVSLVSKAQSANASLINVIDPAVPLEAPETGCVSQYAMIHGINMHYRECPYTGSQAQAPHTCVMLHGAPTNNKLWRNVAPYLQESCNIIIPDMVGHGNSDTPSPLVFDYNLLSQYTQISDLFDYINLQKAVMITHDWGGPVLMHYAAKHKDRIDGIVVAETLAPNLCSPENEAAGLCQPVSQVQPFFTKCLAENYDNGSGKGGCGDYALNRIYFHNPALIVDPAMSQGGTEDSILPEGVSFLPLAFPPITLPSGFSLPNNPSIIETLTFNVVGEAVYNLYERDRLLCSNTASSLGVPETISMVNSWFGLPPFSCENVSPREPYALSAWPKQLIPPVGTYDYTMNPELLFVEDNRAFHQFINDEFKTWSVPKVFLFMEPGTIPEAGSLPGVKEFVASEYANAKGMCGGRGMQHFDQEASPYNWAEKVIRFIDERIDNQ